MTPLIIDLRGKKIVSIKVTIFCLIIYYLLSIWCSQAIQSQGLVLLYQIKRQKKYIKRMNQGPANLTQLFCISHIHR